MAYAGCVATPGFPHRRGRSAVWKTPALKRDIANAQCALGTQLRSLRTARHLSQQKLADATQLHLLTINKLERGESNVTLATLVAIAKALGVHVRDLFGGDG